MNKLERNIFERICVWGILLILTAILLLLYLTSICLTDVVFEVEEIVYFHSDLVWKHLLITGIVLLAGTIVYRKRWYRFWKPSYTIVLLVLGITGYGLFIMSTQLLPISDQASCFDAAKDFLDGDNSPWLKGGYAHRYPNQNGLILFFAFLQLLFGKGNSLIIQFVNLFFACVAVFYLALLFADLLNVRNKRFIMLSLLLYCPMMFYITFIYGTISGLACAAAGMYYQHLFFERNRLKYLLFSGVFLCGAVLFKSNYLIFLVAAVIVYAFYGIHKKKLGGLIGCIFLIAIYIFGNGTVSYLIEKRLDLELEKGTPSVAWITMGLSESKCAPGWNSGYNYYLFSDSGFNSDVAAKKATEDLKQRIIYFKDNPKYAVKFFLKKISSVWNEPTFQSIWIQTVKERPFEYAKLVNSLFCHNAKINRIYSNLYDMIQSFVYLFALLFFILNRKKLTVYSLLPGIVIIGGFLFHLAWEGKSQYTVVYFFLMIPYAVIGYRDTVKAFSDLWNKRKKRIVQE